MIWDCKPEKVDAPAQARQFGLLMGVPRISAGQRARDGERFPSYRVAKLKGIKPEQRHFSIAMSRTVLGLDHRQQKILDPAQQVGDFREQEIRYKRVSLLAVF